MKFNEWVTTYQAEKLLLKRGVVSLPDHIKKFPDPGEYYQTILRSLPTDGGKPVSGEMSACGEDYWYRASQPYYKVYPSIVQMLTKLDISKVAFDSINHPIGESKTLLVRFSEKSPFLGKVKSVLFFTANIDGIDSMWFNLDLGARSEYGAVIAYSMMINSSLHSLIGDSLSEAMDGVQDGPLDKDEVGSLLSLILTLCLIGDSPELIQPEVLNADEHKLQGQHNIEALVAKARRRGKYGFTIGKDIEVMPHYRRPHLALVWYGPGKKKSKIIPRKGSIVHRSKVEKIPTGYGVSE